MKRLLLGLLAAGIAMATYLAWPGSQSLPETPSRSTSPSSPDVSASGTAGQQSARAGTGAPDSGPDVREVIDPQETGPDDIVVQVLDAWRRPIVGFPVALSPDEQVHDIHPDKREIERTDAKGVAVFRSRRNKVSLAKEPWFLVHDVCFEKQPFVQLDQQTLAQDVIVLVQPPYGSVDVVAREADGGEPRNLDRAELSLVDPLEEQDPTLVWKRKYWTAALDADYRARFEFVELGRECVGAVYRRGGETPSKARGDGPVVALQQQQIDVALDIDHAVAVFRAVNELGVPLADTPLLLMVFNDWSWGGSKGTEIKTDPDGRFTVDSHGMAFFGQRVCVKTTGDGGAIGFAKIPRKLEKGRTDCGDVVLRPDGPLASGRVVDERGAPVPGVRVCAGQRVSYRFHRRPQGWPPAVSRGRRSKPGFPIRWDLVKWEVMPMSFGRPTVEARTDEHGDFILRGKLLQPKFKVWVDDVSTRSIGVRVKRGAQEVRLTCFRVCRTAVDVIMGDGVPWEGVGIQLRAVGPRKHIAGAKKTSREGNTVHVWMDAVRPGNYDLRWSFKRQLLGRRENLRIDEDAVFAKIDLRGAIIGHQITLQLPPAQASEKLRGTLLWQPSGSADKSWETVHFSKSSIRFTAPAASIDLRIFVQGFRVETLHGVSEPRTVALRPGLRVRLVLRTTGKIPEHPYLFGPWPCMEGKYVGTAVGSRYYTKTKREVTYLLPVGEVQVGWYLEQRQRGLAVSSTVLDKHNVTIDVKETAGEQVFYLDLDGRALSDLTKRFR